MSATATAASSVDSEHYFCRRVLDAFLREDVGGCVSRGRVVQVPAWSDQGRQVVSDGSGPWLVVEHLGPGALYLPVTPSRFMQRWRLRTLPMVADEPTGLRLLFGLDEILERLQMGFPMGARRHFREFAQECRVALDHARLCESVRRSVEAPGAKGVSSTEAWSDRMLRYERRAAFLDHPFYPTARAKLGFSLEELKKYGPEFAPSFKLRWAAVPKALYKGSEAPIAEIWPGFAQVGLPEDLSESHALMPMHPCTADRLDEFVTEPSIRARIQLGPTPYLDVRPTLSVRTVAVSGWPRWHLKLPLPIRTLGTRNIRTIKPSTVPDGERLQTLVAAIAAREPGICGRLLLTDESWGANVADMAHLGFIARRYPQGLEHSHLVPVAALCADGGDGRSVMEHLADRFYHGRVLDFFDDYADLTLRLHLTLWTLYGVALESNQQNSVVVLADQAPRLRLLIRDNDAGRVMAAMLDQAHSTLAGMHEQFLDRRIVVDDELPLAQMFTTITLQLNVAVLVEHLATAGFATAEALYGGVREKLVALLDEFDRRGADTSMARTLLLGNEHLYIKYLLRAATLEDKSSTGATDVNKFYGQTAPNFLRQ